MSSNLGNLEIDSKIGIIVLHILCLLNVAHVFNFCSIWVLANFYIDAVAEEPGRM